jgi:small nuclear ribonucleoprotein (snRNP)-like protein
MVTFAGKHQISSGIEPIENKEVLAVVDKVIEKIVRVQVSDGREYVGILQSVDQAGTVYVQDALEVVDKRDATFLHHDLITPHLLRFNADKERALKAIGSIVVPRKHVVKISLDHKL